MKEQVALLHEKSKISDLSSEEQAILAASERAKQLRRERQRKYRREKNSLSVLPVDQSEDTLTSEHVVNSPSDALLVPCMS